MSIITDEGHVSRALDLYSKDSLYFGFGKSTPWEDESTPPVPSPDSILDEPLLFKKVESKMLVVPDPEGPLVYQDENWRIVDPSQAYAENARYVYLRSSLLYSEWRTGISYREIGCYQDLVPVSTVEPGQTLLLPEEVEDIGHLQLIDFRRPVWRSSDQQEVIVLIIQL